MNIEDYFKVAITNKYLHKLNWYIVMFSLYAEENEYCVLKENKMYMKVNNEEVELVGWNKDKPFISHHDEVTLSNADMKTIQGNIKTTYGRAIINYLLLVHPFNHVIPYRNDPKELSSSSIENTVMRLLGDDKVTVEEYLNFVDNAMFLANFSRQILTTVTEKNLLPNPEMKQIKADLQKEFENKYGKDWTKNPVYIGEFTATLAKKDDEYLEGDPAKGVTMVGKAAAARGKLLLAYGSNPSGLDPNPKFMTESLADGYPLDGELMSGVINGIIDGSIARGKETQKGGVIYKQLTKMGRDMKVLPGDCGSKLFKHVSVDNDNHETILGLNIKEGSGVREITETKQYIGKTIEVRSPLFCKMGGKNYCEVCVGKNLKDKKDALGLMFTYISEVFLSASLKKMHNTGLKLTDYDMKSNIR